MVESSATPSCFTTEQEALLAALVCQAERLQAHHCWQRYPSEAQGDLVRDHRGHLVAELDQLSALLRLLVRTFDGGERDA